MKLPIPRDPGDPAIAVAFADPQDTPVATVALPPTGIPLDAIERALILFALDSHAGNRTRAAHFLGLSRSALIYRMHKHGLAGGAETHQ